MHQPFWLELISVKYCFTFLVIDPCSASSGRLDQAVPSWYQADRKSSQHSGSEETEGYKEWGEQDARSRMSLTRQLQCGRQGVARVQEKTQGS